MVVVFLCLYFIHGYGFKFSFQVIVLYFIQNSVKVQGVGLSVV